MKTVGFFKYVDVDDDVDKFRNFEMMWDCLEMSKAGELPMEHMTFSGYLEAYSEFMTEKTAWGMTEPAM